MQKGCRRGPEGVQKGCRRGPEGVQKGSRRGAEGVKKGCKRGPKGCKRVCIRGLPTIEKIEFCLLINWKSASGSLKNPKSTKAPRKCPVSTRRRRAESPRPA